MNLDMNLMNPNEEGGQVESGEVGFCAECGNLVNVLVGRDDRLQGRIGSQVVQTLRDAATVEQALEVTIWRLDQAVRLVRQQLQAGRLYEPGGAEGLLKKRMEAAAAQLLGAAYLVEVMTGEAWDLARTTAEGLESGQQSAQGGGRE